MYKFFSKTFRQLRKFLNVTLKIIFRLLLIMLILWLFNNYRIGWKLQNELKAQQKNQSTWQMGNIAAWTCGTIRDTDTVIVLTPEYYEDFYTEKKIAAYNVDSRANYVLTAFKRDFTDPFLVAEDISNLVKELTKTYSSVIIVGHSKGSTISIAMLNYLSDADYDMMVNISSPYSGTILTSPEKIYELVSTKKIFNWEYGKAFYDFYCGMFDGDMADKIIREDSPFLRQLDYSKINKDKFINITAKSGVISFLYDFWNFDAEGIALPLLDSFLDLNGDGLVPLKSQRANMPEDITSIHLKASHKTSYAIGLKKVLENLEK